MSLSQQLKKDFSTLTLALIAVAIVLNIVLGQVVSLLKLPIFLDSLGTILVALLAGPWAAGLTGLLTNLIWGLISDRSRRLCPGGDGHRYRSGPVRQIGLFRSGGRLLSAA